MKDLLLATTNPAKFSRYSRFLAPLQDIRIRSLKDLGINITVEEDGLTAEENARKKAQAYCKASGLPSLSIDEALYIDAFKPEEQPGVNVRRCMGRKATDDEVLDYFVERLNGLPSKTFYWIFAACIATPEGLESLASVKVPGVFADRPKLPITMPGYPLSSLFYYPKCQKYYCELTPEENDERLTEVGYKVRELVSVL